MGLHCELSSACFPVPPSVSLLRSVLMRNPVLGVGGVLVEAFNTPRAEDYGTVHNGFGKKGLSNLCIL